MLAPIEKLTHFSSHPFYPSEPFHHRYLFVYVHIYFVFIPPYLRCTFSSQRVKYWKRKKRKKKLLSIQLDAFLSYFIHYNCYPRCVSSLTRINGRKSVAKIGIGRWTGEEQNLDEERRPIKHEESILVKQQIIFFFLLCLNWRDRIEKLSCIVCDVSRWN